MDFKDFTLGKNDNDRRLDKIIRAFASNLSLSEIYKYLRKVLIKINGKKTKPEAKVFENDVLSIASFILEKNENQPSSADSPSTRQSSLPSAALPPLKPVFENEHILIIDKPYDISVHGNADSLDRQVYAYFKEHHQEASLSFKPGPLHRLDRKTTGLLCFSMSLEGARWFSQNIQTHTIQKKYIALVCGKLLKSESWEDEIKKIDDDKSFKTVKARKISEGEQAFEAAYKKAVTLASPLGYGKYEGMDVSLVSFDIKTGRTHQIRAQSALHKYPLLGDSAYGGRKISGKKSRDFFLTAIELSFPKDNPLGLPASVKLPFPEDFKSFLRSCSIEDFSL